MVLRTLLSITLLLAWEDHVLILLMHQPRLGQVKVKVKVTQQQGL